MTLFSILSLIARALGFFDLADKWWVMHETKVQAKAAANTPKTDSEWTDKADKGEL